MYENAFPILITVNGITLVTLLGVAFSAGKLVQSVSNMRDRLDRIERKLWNGHGDENG